MKISDAGIALIKEFEGCVLRAYPDPATGGEPWTIGVGHTGPDVVPGLVITDEEADDYLRADLETSEKCVNGCVKVSITQQQFDALVSFVFNLGCGNLRKSTLLRKLNDGDDVGAAEQFMLWNRANNREMAGLTRRREAEKNLFLA